MNQVVLDNISKTWGMEILFSHGCASIRAINSVLSNGYFLLLQDIPTVIEDNISQRFNISTVLRYFKDLRYGDLYMGICIHRSNRLIQFYQVGVFYCSQPCLKYCKIMDYENTRQSKKINFISWYSDKH